MYACVCALLAFRVCCVCLSSISAAALLVHGMQQQAADRPRSKMRVFQCWSVLHELNSVCMYAVGCTVRLSTKWFQQPVSRFFVCVFIS
jgi:hypothetical protein